MKISGKTVTILLVPLILLASCKHRAENNKLIPSKDLVEILTELYMGDALLSVPSMKSQFSSKDSVLNHIDIIKKHGFTKESMDKTLRYYFEKKPKKLENIYDQVLTVLNEKQVLIEKELDFRKQNPGNLWNKNIRINVPEAGKRDPVWFKVEAKDTGIYILEFMATIFRDDKSLNPRITVFFWHTDSSSADNRLRWDEIKLPKDGKKHSYSLSKRLTDTTYKYVGGWLLNSDLREGSWKKHAIIENIVLKRTIAK